MAGDDKIKELAKERAKQKAKQRLEQISSGDLTRGLGGAVNSRSTVSEVVETARKKTASKDYVEMVQQETKPVNNQAKETTNVAKKNKKLENQIAQTDAKEVISVNASQGKEKRNKLIISILATSIVLVWAFIVILRVINPSKPDHNFYVHLSGDKAKSCEVLLNGTPRTDWHIKNGLTVGKNYEDNITLKISSEGECEVRFRLEVYKNTTRLTYFGKVDTGEGFVINYQNGTEWYVDTVNSPSEITILTKISFIYSSRYPEMQDLNSNNIRINLYIEVN